MTYLYWVPLANMFSHKSPHLKTSIIVLKVARKTSSIYKIAYKLLLTDLSPEKLHVLHWSDLSFGLLRVMVTAKRFTFFIVYLQLYSWERHTDIFRSVMLVWVSYHQLKKTLLWTTQSWYKSNVVKIADVRW